MISFLQNTIQKDPDQFKKDDIVAHIQAADNKLKKLSNKSEKKRNTKT